MKVLDTKYLTIEVDEIGEDTAPTFGVVTDLATTAIAVGFWAIYFDLFGGRTR